MENWEEVKIKLSHPAKVIITSHQSPYGDSIGSSLAMFHLLSQMNHDVVVITPDRAAEFLHWMDGFEEVLNFEENREEVIQQPEHAEIIFCLDFNATSRLGEFGEFVRLNEKAYKINIDHHQDPENFADFHFFEMLSHFHSG